MTVGDEFEVEVGAFAHGGSCVARVDGRVVFVRHALPGERVRVRVTEDRGGSFARADAIDVLDASPDRVERPCPISGPGGAGCCDLAHVAFDAQRDLLAGIVREQLARLGGLDRGPDRGVEALPGQRPDGTRYRTRVRLAVDADGRAGYRAYRGRRVVTRLDCPQVDADLFDGLADARFTPEAEVQVVLDDAGLRHVVEWAPSGGSRATRDTGRRGAAARRAAAARPRTATTLEGGSVVARVGDRQWDLGVGDFWQAHRGAAQTYSDLIAEWADAPTGGVAWDLYGGAGVFAAALADGVGDAGRVVSVESSASASASGAGALADLEHVEFVRGRVESVAPTLPDPDVVVLDPPRSGAGRDVIGVLADTGARRVVHVGCDPASFGRDVGLYREHGFTVEGVRSFAAFPLTHHVESIALLTR